MTNIAAPGSRRKIALLIGNQNYSRAEDRLRHTQNDVDDISTMLRQMNFQVKTKHDLTRSQMDATLSEFANILSNGDIVVFYFSGHGYEISGRNYLTHVDEDSIQSDDDVKRSTIDVERILYHWSQSNPSSAIICILDCCRLSYPRFRRKPNIHSEKAALHRMEPIPGVYVVFACSSNQIASDGLADERNGLFAKHLLKHLFKPKKDLNQLFRTVTNGVCIESKQKQKPTRLDGLTDRASISLHDKRNKCKSI